MVALTVLAFTALAGPVRAQDADALTALQSASAIRCIFQAGVLGEWRDGRVERELTSDVGMAFQYHDINSRAGTARMTGTQGEGAVSATLTPSGLTLTRTTPSGNHSFTTVFPRYQADTSSFLAVHSRHVLLSPDPLPAQYYGVCKKAD